MKWLQNDNSQIFYANRHQYEYKDKQWMAIFDCSWSYNTPSVASKLSYCANAWYWYQICMSRSVCYKSDDIKKEAFWINHVYSIFHIALCISPRPISGFDQYQASGLMALGWYWCLVLIQSIQWKRACIILYTFSMYIPVIMLYFQLWLYEIH